MATILDFNSLNKRVSALEESSSGNIQLPSDITCNSITLGSYSSYDGSVKIYKDGETVDIGMFNGTLIAGTNFSANNNMNVQGGTCIVGYSTRFKNELEYVEQMGTIFMSSNYSVPYSVYWPRYSYNAEWHGAVKVKSDFNLLDNSGNCIIQDGYFAGEGAIIFQQDLDRYEYVYTSEYSDTYSIMALAPALYVHFDDNRFDSLNLFSNNDSIITTGDYGGTFIGGRSSYMNIDNATNYTNNGSVLFGYSSQIHNNNSGLIALGKQSTYKGENTGTIIAGSDVATNSNEMSNRGTFITGENAYLNIKENKGVIISGSIGGYQSYEITSGNYTDGTMITTSSDDFTPARYTRCGLILEASKDLVKIEPGSLILDPDRGQYTVWWPSEKWMAAKQHGFLKCANDFSLLDARGYTIIENGIFVGNLLPSATISNESQTPIASVPNTHVLTDEEYEEFLEMKDMLKWWKENIK